MKLLSYAAPFFFLLIFLELIVARIKRRSVYRLNDAFADIGCGIVETMMDAAVLAIKIIIYNQIYDRWAILKISDSSITAWVVAFVLVDLAYYWAHRSTHRVNILWTGHVVHHQSEDYNLAVALRQSAFQGLQTLVFYLPLAIIGFPGMMVFGVFFINLLYQFWIHTKLIKRLGFLEIFMNTPSHHRVHHGRNPKYMDKNYAGTFIVWDKLFGSFVEEEEEPVYGITNPLNSWDPVYANFQYWVEMIKKTKEMPTLWDKIQVWFRAPNWRPQSLGGPMPFLPVDPKYRKYETPTSLGLKVYTLLQLALLTVAVLYWLQNQMTMGWQSQVLLLAAILLSFTVTASWLNKRTWAWPLEVFRAAAIGFATLAYMINA